ncbi:MAG: hypothetical protein K2J03_07180 [Muribaculaceae bacterium]|nr:hypothetical protein [Muribaculaceae bacterium]
MNMEEQLYTIEVYSEHHVGVLHQVAMTFSRRCVNIEYLEAKPCSTAGVHKITVVFHSSPEIMEQIVKQLEKRVDILRVSLLPNQYSGECNVSVEA